MKFRYLLTSVLACLALAIGCTQEELPGLSDIEVTPSYFTFTVDGGSKDVTVTTSQDWTVTDVPEWVTVSPASGKGNGKFTVSTAASTDTLARTAFLKVNAGKETQLVTVNQDAFIPDFPEFKGGDYWIVFDGGAATPLSSSYGYLYTAPVNKDEAGKITSTAQNIFTFTAVEGGFTIQDPSKQYYCMQGSYDSFNVYATLPETGGVWTVKQVGSTEYQIVNAANGKVVQYDPAYSSAGAYSSERGILANLVKVEVIPEPEPLGDATEIKDATEIEPEIIVEGLVTASSTKGVIVTDKTGSLLVYGINSEVKVGDALKVKGNLSSYNKGYQLANPHQYEIASSDNKIEYPEATELSTVSIPELVKPAIFLAQYVSVKGIVAPDKYNNAILTVGDYTVKSYYSHDSYADFAEKAAEVKGYLVAYKESAMELSLIVTSIEEIEGWEPEEPVVPEGPKATPLAEILALGENGVIADGTFIEAVVISNAGLGNLTSKKNAYLQDESAAIQVRFNADHEFSFGDKVKVDLSGLKLTTYNKAIQLSGIDNETVEVLSSGNVVTPKTVSMADFLANKYEGQYVAVEGVQVVEADLEKTFVTGGAHTSINIEDAAGNAFIVFSSKYSTYGEQTVPQGSGVLKGIAARNNDQIQIIFAQESDWAGLTGERF